MNGSLTWDEVRDSHNYCRDMMNTLCGYAGDWGGVWSGLETVTSICLTARGRNTMPTAHEEKHAHKPNPVLNGIRTHTLASCDRLAVLLLTGFLLDV